MSRPKRRNSTRNGKKKRTNRTTDLRRSNRLSGQRLRALPVGERISRLLTRYKKSENSVERLAILINLDRSSSNEADLAGITRPSNDNQDSLIDRERDINQGWMLAVTTGKAKPDVREGFRREFGDYLTRNAKREYSGDPSEFVRLRSEEVRKEIMSTYDDANITDEDRAFIVYEFMLSLIEEGVVHVVPNMDQLGDAFQASEVGKDATFDKKAAMLKLYNGFSTGFTDQNTGRIYMYDNKQDQQKYQNRLAGYELHHDIFHEVMHLISGEFGKTAMQDSLNPLNEGITEYFTKRFMQHVPLEYTQTAYGDSLPLVEAIAETIGDKELFNIYANGGKVEDIAAAIHAQNPAGPNEREILGALKEVTNTLIDANLDLQKRRMQKTAANLNTVPAYRSFKKKLAKIFGDQLADRILAPSQAVETASEQKRTLMDQMRADDGFDPRPRPVVNTPAAPAPTQGAPRPNRVQAPTGLAALFGGGQGGNPPAFLRPRPPRPPGANPPNNTGEDV